MGGLIKHSWRFFYFIFFLLCDACNARAQSTWLCDPFALSKIGWKTYSATCYYDDILALKVLVLFWFCFPLWVSWLNRTVVNTIRYRSLGYTDMNIFDSLAWKISNQR